MHPLRRPRAPAPAPTSVVPVVVLPLYPRLLGRAFGELEDGLRAFLFTTHERRAQGRAVLRRGIGLAARLLGWLLSLPAAVGEATLALVVTPRRAGERWEHRLGDAVLTSDQRALPGGLLGERLGRLELRARPVVEAGALRLCPAGAALRLGPLCLPLPGRLAPRLEACLSCGEDGPLRMRLTISTAFGALLLACEAELRGEK